MLRAIKMLRSIEIALSRSWEGLEVGMRCRGSMEESERMSAFDPCRSHHESDVWALWELILMSSQCYEWGCNKCMPLVEPLQALFCKTVSASFPFQDSGSRGIAVLYSH